MNRNDVKLIAFYLPQFHPIPENDAWWGKGFTEWTNVTSAKPLFPGHYQPHLPADLGFYDLRLTEAREDQANLAKKFGIYGFCYYYYYFDGKRLLNRPLDDVLATGTPDFPFCICWANENWTRQWDGFNDDILIEQNHSSNADAEFIYSLLPVLNDKRYIRVGDKLLLLVYRTELLHNPVTTSKIWREIVSKELNKELYLCNVDQFVKAKDPRLYGFDATVQFPWIGNDQCTVNNRHFAAAMGFDPKILDKTRIINFPSAANYLLSTEQPDYPLFRGVMPSWDNTPRRKTGNTVFINSSPQFYKIFLKATIAKTIDEHKGDERILFINAWNEWGEGAHLEPDQKYGLSFLEATKEALLEHADYKLLMKQVNDIKSESTLFFDSAGLLQEQLENSEEKINELVKYVEEQKNQFTEQISLLSQEIREKDQTILQLEKLLEQKDLVIINKENQLLERENILLKTNKETELVKIKIEQLNSRLLILESEISEKEALINSMDSVIREINVKLIEYEEKVRINDNLLSTKDSEIQFMNSIIHEKTDTITLQDEQICEQKRTIEKLNDLILEKEAAFSGITEQLQKAFYSLNDKEGAIRELSQSLAKLYKSFSWKLTYPMRIIGLIFIKIFRVISHSLNLIKQEGLIHFFQKQIKELHPVNGRESIDIEQNDNDSDLKKIFTEYDKSVPIITVFVPFRFYPPVFGGGVRIMNIYAALSKYFDIHLIGMGGLGDTLRREVINDHLSMYFIPNTWDFHNHMLSEEKKANGPLHDILLTTKFNLLPDLVRVTKFLSERSNIFISSHPYFIPLFEKYLSNKFIIYEAHNLDFSLKQTYFENPIQNKDASYYLDLVKSVEAKACHYSKLIITVSEQERDEISSFYHVSKKKMVVVPNCIDVFSSTYFYKGISTMQERKILFIGSAHSPNIEAAEFIITYLAPRTPQYKYIIVGSLKNVLQRLNLPENVELTGIITEVERNQIFRISDLAINPMFSGSGTNLKVLDYLASGIPLLSTSFGMRGFETLLPGIFIGEKDDFLEQMERIFSLHNSILSEKTAKARELVEKNFDKSVVIRDLVPLISI